MIRSYTWGPGIDNLLAMTVYGSETNTYYALKDHQNSVLALTDETGSIAESYEYDAWGNPTIFDSNGTEIANHQSAIGNRYLFQGREYDSATGLYYFRARWYSPEIGRWLSKDPIGISGGLNLYVFCGNNPVNFVDPYGESWFMGEDQEPVMGRDGFPFFNPDNPVMNAIETYYPNAHDFAVVHDTMVSILTTLGVPDWIANVPTMPIAFTVALVGNLTGHPATSSTSPCSSK